MSSFVLRPRKRSTAQQETHCQATKRNKSRDQQQIGTMQQTTKEFEENCCPPSLNCKENIPPSLTLRSHASKPTLVTPPSFPQQDSHGFITTGHLPNSRKPISIGSPLSHVQSLSMLPHQGQAKVVSPLPQLSWTDSGLLWQQMRQKDTCIPAPETELRIRHPSIMPTMRTILLDWMLEVCEEYRIHRETFYLSVDIYDRFMDTQVNVLKEQLQLIGVTCLFIASKIEEIYPPKLSDFAYVTDGACNTEEIVYMELLICKSLNWRLHHKSVSANTWTNIYMQLVSSYFRPPGLKAKEFEYPAFSPYEFIRVMQVLDLCTLDLASRQFCNSILSASALYLVSEKCQSHLHLVTGFHLTDIYLCIQWMQPFVTVINRTRLPIQKAFKGVILQDAHNIQTHEVTIQMLEDVFELRKYKETHLLPHQTDPVLMDCSVLMTPPKQERRYLAPLNGTIV